MNYRREIDGLRAFAVAPVILFHAGFQAFGGGFVGVDVFFVISGYLITSIILAELETGRFSIVNFYERRARRILPALFVVLFACLTAAWSWLPTQDMRSFSDSLVAVSLFASNILFWKTSGYFDTAAELKPLLHTWSLAVEEQYYLLFPVFLIGAWRLGKRRISMLMAVALAISLGLAQWASNAFPTAGYFLPPTRVWELLIGALVAFHLSSSAAATGDNKTLAEAGGVIGLSLLTYAVFAFTEKTPFPGLYALVPTLGAALIILYSNEQTIVGRLLGHRILVGMGLVSYSAYLWHQPLFSFLRLRSLTEPSKGLMALLALAVFVLAYFSWKYVETPFRRRKLADSRTKIFLYASVGSAFFIAVGLAGHLNDGYPQRIGIENAQLRTLALISNVYRYYDYDHVVRYKECHSVSDATWERHHCRDVRKHNILLWGDSYAASLYSGLNEVRNQRHPEFGVTQVTDGNGSPFYIEGRTDSGRSLAEVNDSRLRVASEIKPELIVITWMFDGTNGLNNKQRTVSELNKTIDKILQASPHSQIVVIGPFPHWIGSLQKQMLGYFQLKGALPPKYMSFGLQSKDKAWDDFCKEAMPRPNVRYVSALDLLCKADGCLTRLSDDITDITAIDWGHLTRHGAIYLATRMENLIFTYPRPVFRAPG